MSSPSIPAVFAKLQLKSSLHIAVIDAPTQFEFPLQELAAAAPGVSVYRSVGEAEHIDFAVAFATTQQQVDAAARALAARIEGDGLLWMAYPKASSKRYRCDFNRDTGWALLGELGFEPVRQVAIDEDWSALRFRRVEYIKKMTRTFAMTDEGKAKAAQGRTAVN
jgi:hypothetical protein